MAYVFVFFVPIVSGLSDCDGCGYGGGGSLSKLGSSGFGGGGSGLVFGGSGGGIGANLRVTENFAAGNDPFPPLKGPNSGGFGGGCRGAGSGFLSDVVVSLLFGRKGGPGTE